MSLLYINIECTCVIHCDPVIVYVCYSLCFCHSVCVLFIVFLSWCMCVIHCVSVIVYVYCARCPYSHSKLLTSICGQLLHLETDFWSHVKGDVHKILLIAQRVHDHHKSGRQRSQNGLLPYVPTKIVSSSMSCVGKLL